MRDTEHKIQVAVMKWAALQTCAIPQLANLFAIPNGGARHAVVGAKMKAEGVKRGVPDLFLAAPANGFHGLFIEMKAPGGRLREDQALWIARLEEEGYSTAVCKSFESARETILDYLNI